MSEDSTIRDIVIVGGGDAGLLTALLFRKHHPGGNIVVVDDFDEDPPEVGKSTFGYIVHILHNELGISKRRFREEVKPVWKTAARFEDWCGQSFSIPFDEQPFIGEMEDTMQELAYRYNNKYYETVGTEIAEEQKTPFKLESGVEKADVGEGDVPPLEGYGAVAYHLDLKRFNPFLETVARERGVEIYDGEVTGVDTEAGRITEIQSGTRSFNADLYIDASGFNRVLMGELDAEFTAFDIPLNRAITTTVLIDTEDIVPASIHRSADNGWMWQIDTYQTRDIGYVYSSQHTSDEAAMSEFLDAHSDTSICSGDVTQYGFESGRLNRPWVGNCVAVGNASGFVEPLQALGLMVSIIFTEQLSSILSNKGWVLYDGMQDVYNEIIKGEWEEIYNFLVTHYVHVDGDTEFWEDMSELTTKGQKRHLFYDSIGYTKYGEFSSTQGSIEAIGSQEIYHLLLSGLGVESTVFEKLGSNIGPEAEERVETHRNDVKNEVDEFLTYEELYNMLGW